MGPSPDHNQCDISASDFLAGASHELRTPLNAIVGMLELALGESLPLTLRDYLTTARDSAHSLTVSLDNLLDLARADAGQLPFDSVACDLSEMVSAALGPLSRRSTARRILTRLHTDLPHDLLGDTHRLQQIIVPLVEYSLKCLDASAVVVEIGLLSSDRKGAILELGVGARGLVTSEGRIRYVPFVPAEASKYSAAGLGLTIAQRWIRHLHGELWVDPRPGGDGEFYGTLRLERGARRLARGPSPTAAFGFSAPLSDEAWAGTDRPLNVLVADDTQANQKVMKAVLTKRGHHVELADNGRQALDQVRHRQFDVVLMDAQMPAMNGLEAASAIRSLPDDRRAKVPIIAMTAHAMHEDRQRCLAAGMDDYLSKPIDVAALIARVEFHGTSGRSGPLPLDRPVSVAQRDREEDYISGALARLGGDAALLHELIRLFRQDAVALVDKMHAGLAIHDAEAVARGAHNLKGLAANFDAAAVVRAAALLERLAGQEKLSTAAGALTELEVALDELTTALSRYEPPSDDRASDV